MASGKIDSNTISLSLSPEHYPSIQRPRERVWRIYAQDTPRIARSLSGRDRKRDAGPRQRAVQRFTKHTSECVYLVLQTPPPLVVDRVRESQSVAVFGTRSEGSALASSPPLSPGSPPETLRESGSALHFHFARSARAHS